MCMIVKPNKSNLEGVKALHNYLYGLSEPNYEVLEIYDQIDSEVDEIETEIAEMQDEVSAEEHLEDMKNDLYALVADIDKCKLSPEAITEEIKRILF